MGSKFGRDAGLRKKPGVCKAPPKTGPLDERWPPRIGTGLCSWRGYLGDGTPLDLHAILDFKWDVHEHQYQAQTPNATHQLIVYCRREYVYPEWHITVNYRIWPHQHFPAYAHVPLTPFHKPVIISTVCSCDTAPDHSILFALSAFPLV